MFDGSTYEAQHDEKRLTSQLEAVRRLMSDGVARTPGEMEKALGVSWASISARLRDLRKERMGGYVVERKRVEPASAGIFTYRLREPERPPEFKWDDVGQGKFL